MAHKSPDICRQKKLNQLCAGFPFPGCCLRVFKTVLTLCTLESCTRANASKCSLKSQEFFLNWITPTGVRFVRYQEAVCRSQSEALFLSIGQSEAGYWSESSGAEIKTRSRSMNQRQKKFDKQFSPREPSRIEFSWSLHRWKVLSEWQESRV